MGNCGVGFAPVRPAERDWLLDLLDAVEDIPSTAMSAGITWEWETFPEYLDAIDGKPRVMDIATQIPHSPLRCYVMGARGAEDIQPTDEELTHMARLVREAIEAGAVGFSSNRLMAHRTKAGVPTPGSFARYPELEAIARGMSEGGGGVFQVVGDFEGDWVDHVSQEPNLTVTYLFGEGLPGSSFDWRDGLRRAEKARERGIRLFPQIRGRGTCALLSLEGSAHPYGLNLAYRELVADLPFKERIVKMRDPEVKAAILASEWDLSNDVRQFMDADPAGHIFLIDGTPGSLHAIFLENLLSNPHMSWVLGDPPNYEPEYEASVAAYAERHGISSDEAFYDLLTEGDGSTILLHYLEGYSQGNLDYQREQMMHPLTRNGLSDAGAHVGSLSDVEMVSWNLRYWGWQRERGERVPIETIVHKQSGANADLYGLGDRGVLAVGKRADLNVIDPERLGSRAPHIIYDLPEGAKRYHQRQTGYEFTLCAGQITLEDDELTGALPGRLVRGPRDA
jgi:N-acyl-D-amino-acid deacylase